MPPEQCWPGTGERNNQGLDKNLICQTNAKRGTAGMLNGSKLVMIAIQSAAPSGIADFLRLASSCMLP